MRRTALGGIFFFVLSMADVAGQGPTQPDLVVLPQNAEVGVGSTLRLFAYGVRPANVRWASSDSTIATIDPHGRVTGVRTGTVRVTAVVVGAAQGATDVRVNAPVAAVVAPAALDVVQHCERPLEVALKDQRGRDLHGRPIEWEIDPPGIASLPAGPSGPFPLPRPPADPADSANAESISRFLLSQSRSIRGAAPGTATVTATSEARTGTTTVTVAPAIPTAVEIRPGGLVLDVGQSHLVAGWVSNQEGCRVPNPSLTWTVSDPNVARFDPATQKVTGLASGQTTLTARAANGVSGAAQIAVPAVASVSVSPSRATLDGPLPKGLTATPKAADGTPLANRAVDWQASSDAVTLSPISDYLSQQATATGHRLGTTTITATAEGVSGVAQIDVTALPFAFRRLDVYDSMSGPELFEVRGGTLGASRRDEGEYQVWNPGDTSGTTRVPLYGTMTISFAAPIPETGDWVLQRPEGRLEISGHSYVHGEGNATTSYDAKVWVTYHEVLWVGPQVLEESLVDVHYDATRSEDRTKHFRADQELTPRTVSFHANSGETLYLTLQITIRTEANEDGEAKGVIDVFGFLANTTADYDKIIYRAP